MKIRPANQAHARHLASAIDSLVAAKCHAVLAGCPSLAKKIRSALKSADGARRHLDHRLLRTNSDGSSRHYLEIAR
jgi:hypothetical protein